MQNHEKENSLFTELTPEEAVTVTGGRSTSFNRESYIFRLGFGILLRRAGLISNEIQFAWDWTFGYGQSSRKRRQQFYWLIYNLSQD
jgi:hypothetical protein